MEILDLLRQPWPWYVAGSLIGLTVPALLFLGNKHFGISANLRHVCAMIPNKNPFFNYNWRKESWNLIFALGILLGGFVGAILLANPEPSLLSAGTKADLAALGVETDNNYLPTKLFSWTSLFTLRGFIIMVLGGFLVGFGARYAGGCTSGPCYYRTFTSSVSLTGSCYWFLCWGPFYDSYSTTVYSRIIKENLMIQTQVLSKTQTIFKPNLLLAYIGYLSMGFFFGFVLIKAEVISWYRIQEMFRFQSFHMYGIIGSAVVVGMASIWLIRHFRARALIGKDITFTPKAPTYPRYIIGGTNFWSWMGTYWCLPGTNTNPHRWWHECSCGLY